MGGVCLVSLEHVPWCWSGLYYVNFVEEHVLRRIMFWVEEVASMLLFDSLGLTVTLRAWVQPLLPNGVVLLHNIWPLSANDEALDHMLQLSVIGCNFWKVAYVFQHQLPMFAP